MQSTATSRRSQTQGSESLDVAAQATILGALPVAVVVVDSNEVISYANDRAIELIPAPLIGRRSSECLGSIDELREIESNATREGRRPSVRIENGSGGLLELGIQLANLPLDLLSEPSVLITFQDIGWYLRLRSERDVLLKNATVGAVLPSILHELKNPLASVTSAVELLVEETPPGNLQNDLHAILSEVRRMKLGFEGIGIAGREIHSPRSTAVDLAIREAVQVFQGRAKRDGIRLESRIPHLPLLPLDGAVVRAIVFNLVSNALHASRRGDRITVSCGVEDEGSSFVLEIADTGTGMTPEIADRCCDLFYTTKSSGSGIGLALCKNTIDSVGGDFEITSETSKGTSIHIRVPLTMPTQEQPMGRK